MSRRNRQQFLAYRSLSDQFEIEFYAGPLDGAKIFTDVLPDSDTFLHRVGSRTYSYRYRQVSPLKFNAHHDAFARPERRQKKSGLIAKRLKLALACIIAALGFGFFAWFIVNSFA